MGANKYDKSLIFIFILFVVFGAFFHYKNWQNNKEYWEDLRKDEVEILALKNKIDSLELDARAVSVIDGDSLRVLYGKNDEEVMPIASLTKILSVVVALSNKNENQNIVIRKSALDQEGDSGLYLNEIWDKSELAKFSLLVSSNDGVIALSEGKEDFLINLNEKAKKLGLTNTYFSNISGLDVSDTVAGAFSTAKEVNIMAIYAWRAEPEIFLETAQIERIYRSLSGLEHKATNTNIGVGKIPNLLFSKTGNTDLAGGNLTVIFKNESGKTLAVTLLGSTPLGRFSDMEKITGVLYTIGDEN